MPRLFIAIDLPEEHKIRLSGLRIETLPARWTPPAQYHLTIRFLGEVGADRIASMEHVLAAVRAEAFSLQGSGLGVFPSIRRPQVLFAAIDPAPALMDLQTKIEHALCTLGLDADAKPFRPHVTVARLQRAQARTVRAYLRTQTAFVLPSFDVMQYTLYESTLRPEGALHTQRCSFPLPSFSENLNRFSESNNQDDHG